MLPMLILGLVLAFFLILVLRWAAAADPKALLRLLLWTVGGVLLATFVFLAVTGRLAWAAAALAALLPWLFRALRLATFGPGLARLLRALGLVGGGGGFAGLGAGPGRTGPDPDDVSTVETRFLRMSLNHATGAMTGAVRAGTFAGRRLDDLDRAEVAALRGEVQGDPESLRVLDAWIERARPDWASDDGGAGRQDAGGGAGGGGGGGGGPMTRAEALAILGLEEGADADAIKAAHRRLIAMVHPDRGGSPYLAARLNEARDLLMGARS